MTKDLYTEYVKNDYKSIRKGNPFINEQKILKMFHRKGFPNGQLICEKIINLIGKCKLKPPVHIIAYHQND